MTRSELNNRSGERIARFIRCIFLVYTAGLFFSTLASAQSRFRVVNSRPAQNAVAARATDSILVRFDTPLEPATVRQFSIWLYGNLSGYVDFSLSMSSDRRELRIVPESPLVEGESVSLVLKHQQLQQRLFLLTFRIGTLGGMLSTGFDSLQVLLDPRDRQPAKIAAGFFNDDPYPDLVVVNSTSSTVTVLLSERGQSFRVAGSFKLPDPLEPAQSARTPVDVQSGDLDKDGAMDFVVLYFYSNAIYIFWGDGQGNFFPEPISLVNSGNVATAPPGLRPASIDINDLDLDGDLDLAVAFNGENLVKIFLNADSSNRATRRFIERAGDRLSPGVEVGAFGVASAVLKPATGSSNPIGFVLLNTGSNSITFFERKVGGEPVAMTLPLPFRPVAVQVANTWDHSARSGEDDLPEVIVLSNNATVIGKTAEASFAPRSQISIFAWDTARNLFRKIDSLQFDQQVLSFGLARLNGDTRLPLQQRDQSLDLLVATYNTDSLLLHLNQGEILSPNALMLASIAAPRAMITSDFNRDGIEDLVIASHTQNRLTYLRSKPPQTRTIICDFGDVFINTCKTLNKSLILDNPLPDSMQFVWSDRVTFQILPAAFRFQPGQPVTTELTFCPRDTIVYQETVDLIKVDAPSGTFVPVRLLLRGRGVDVDFAIQPDTCDFGIIPPNFVARCTLRVENNASGQLAVWDMNIANRNPAFRIENRPDTLLVDPYGSGRIVVAFAPTAEGTFSDILRLRSNDPERPQAQVVLLGRSSRSRPAYCAFSPDTVIAIEHQPFCFTTLQGNCAVPVDSIDGCVAAVFEDPDRGRLAFRYRNLPAWIRSTIVAPDGKATIRGIPGEGARDTLFTVIAERSFVAVAQQIYVRIIPVNDAPVFLNLPADTTIVENQVLQFEVRAEDPEGAPLTVEALDLSNLPGGNATFDADTRVFRWQPPFGSVGDWAVNFRASEVGTPDPPTGGTEQLSSIAPLNIHVIRALPDLVMEAIELSRPDIRLNQTAGIRAIFTNRNAPTPADTTVGVRILVNDQVVLNTELERPLAPDEQSFVETTYTFTQTQRFKIAAEIDFQHKITELDEDNNFVVLEIDVKVGALQVEPNPFTPNGDGYNDVIFFETRELAMEPPLVLQIFDMQGRRLYHLTGGPHQTRLQWNGMTEDNKPLLPGVYLYYLKDVKNNSHQGYVILAR